MKVLTENNLLECQKKIKILSSRILNYKLFEEVFNILKDYGFISRAETPLRSWINCKNYSLKNDCKILSVDMSKTKQFNKFRQKNVLIHKSVNTKTTTELKQLLREVYGNKVGLEEDIIP